MAHREMQNTGLPHSFPYKQILQLQLGRYYSFCKQRLELIDVTLKTTSFTGCYSNENAETWKWVNTIYFSYLTVLPCQAQFQGLGLHVNHVNKGFNTMW